MIPAVKTGFDCDRAADDYAKRHRDTDTGVVEVYHLPTGAGEREIRLLEVNNKIVETSPLEPLDFGVNVGLAEGHTLVVLDVTPKQWKAIRAGKLPLPPGWSLESSRPAPGPRGRRK